MATLSMNFSPATLKIALQGLGRRHSRAPTQPVLQLLIAIAGLTPETVPLAAVERQGQLPLRPDGILFPQGAKAIAQPVWDVERTKLSHVAFVETQKLAAGGQIVVDHVKDFAIDSLLQSGEGDCIRAVIHVG